MDNRKLCYTLENMIHRNDGLVSSSRHTATLAVRGLKSKICRGDSGDSCLLVMEVLTRLIDIWFYRALWYRMMDNVVIQQAARLNWYCEVIEFWCQHPVRIKRLSCVLSNFLVSRSTY